MGNLESDIPFLFCLLWLGLVFCFLEAAVVLTLVISRGDLREPGIEEVIGGEYWTWIVRCGFEE